MCSPPPPHHRERISKKKRGKCCLHCLVLFIECILYKVQMIVVPTVWVAATLLQYKIYNVTLCSEGPLPTSRWKVPGSSDDILPFPLRYSLRYASHFPSADVRHYQTKYLNVATSSISLYSWCWSPPPTSSARCSTPSSARGRHPSCRSTISGRTQCSHWLLLTHCNDLIGHWSFILVKFYLGLFNMTGR